MEHGTAIDQLDRDLRAFEIQINRYFAGALEMPPSAFQDELAVRIRELRSKPTPSVAEQFRLNSLTDRFNSIRELFRRRLREQEVGGKERPAGQEAYEPDPRQGVVLDGSPAAPELRALYDALYQDGQGRKASFQSFQTYLDRELDSIRVKTGCERVRFRVENAGDRPRLKALPLFSEDT